MSPTRWIQLWRYYHRKRRQPVFDLTVPLLHGIKRSQVGAYQFQTVIYPYHEVVVTVVDVVRLEGKLAKGVHLDISGVVGKPPIRHCTFQQFVDIYGDWILTPELNNHWLP